MIEKFNIKATLLNIIHKAAKKKKKKESVGKREEFFI